MRLLRFRKPGESTDRAGRLESDQIHVLAGDIFDSAAETGEVVPLAAVDLCPPVAPSKIVAIGWNYVGHADELGYLQPGDPLMFLKAPSALIGPNDDIVRPGFSKQLSYEGELVAVIGDDCVNVPPDEAFNHIYGWTVGNDVTDREIQKGEVQYARSKSFDTFCPIGPWVDTKFDHTSFNIETRVNDELTQSGGADLMIHKIPEIVAWVSRAITLRRGDIIMTGTPRGVGIIEPGDQVEVTIGSLGSLCNAVVEESAGHPSTEPFGAKNRKDNHEATSL